MRLVGDAIQLYIDNLVNTGLKPECSGSKVRRSVISSIRPAYSCVLYPIVPLSDVEPFFLLQISSPKELILIKRS